MEVIRGILSVKQYGRIKDKTFENHLCILYHGVKTLSPRIDLYDTNSVEQNKTVDCKQTVYIETASWRKLDIIGPTLSFEVKNGSQRYTLIFKDNAMLREWLLSLCCISQGLFASKHVVGVNSEGVIHPSLITKEEALAAISNTASNFFVLADQSEACYNLGLKGVFNMVIGQGIIKLSPITGNMTVKWSIEYLRTYGFSPQTVFIHAGSRSSTGEGRFVFRTMESKKINDSIDQQAAIIEDNKTGTNSSHSVFPTNGKDNVPEKVTAAALSKVSTPKDFETEYSNVKTNTLSVTSQDDNFLKQLDNTLDSKRQLVARTLSNSSFESGHVTQDKQARKKLEKEQKRKEEDAKKQQKRQQELDKKQQKRRQEEEKKQRLRGERDKKEEKRKQEEEKKVQKKLAKQNIQKKASHAESPPPEPEDLYANADDMYEVPKFSQASLDCDYAQAGDFTPKSYPVQLKTNTTQIYQDPWDNKALPSPVNGQIQLIDDIYAQPNKKTNIPKPLANDSYPPDYCSTYGGPPPPIIPPTCAVDDSSGGSDNIYAHTNDASNSATIDSGNVYGIGSASAAFVSKKEAVGNPANVYDNL